MNEKISKLSTAEEQLITAIKLYFEDKSPVSVHTLIRASHEILDNICKHLNLERGAVQQGLDQIKPEFKKKVIENINKTKNFFKHADHDPDPNGIIEWNPEFSAPYIFDSISLYWRITNNKMTPEILSFALWYRAMNPELWNGQPTEFEELISETADILKNASKQEAFRLLIDAYNNSKT